MRTQLKIPFNFMTKLDIYYLISMTKQLSPFYNRPLVPLNNNKG